MSELLLKGYRMAIVATDGFEQPELEAPRRVVASAGAWVNVVAPHGGKIQGFNQFETGESVIVDAMIADVDSAYYDALVIPGGLFSSDQLRTNPDAITFVRACFDGDTVIAAMGYGSQVLISADVVSGRRMTSAPSIAKDIENAGANWGDADVVIDRGLITGRAPAGLDAFCAAIVDALRGKKGRADSWT